MVLASKAINLHISFIRLKDETTATKIIDSVRDEISNSGFQVSNLDEQVKILDGKDEGVGLWVTANYVAGTLGIVSFHLIVSPAEHNSVYKLIIL